MKSLRTLYLESNGFGRVVVTADTVLRGVLHLKDGAQPPKCLQGFPSIVDLYAHLRQFYDRLSYVGDWRDAFLASPKLDVEVCNINNLVHLAKCLTRIRRYDLIVVSHVAAGDDMTIMLRTAGMLTFRACPMIVFLGNEYDLLDDKIEFVRRVRAERLCSQLPVNAAQYLYQDIPGTKLLSTPHALNPTVYCPPDPDERDIDIGFAGDLYWPFVGDDERTRLIYYFQNSADIYGLSRDIRTGWSARMPRLEWARFLQRCRGLIGAESGTYYLNEKGSLLNKARDYNLNEARDATFGEVYQRFYAGVPREVSGKSVSSRHFEPIGAKTCQILLEGDYNGILRAHEHYIPVRRDLSNIDEAIREFRDAGRRKEIVENAYEYVMSGHTYAHRVADILSDVF